MRTTVQKAYLFDGQQAQRVLAASNGKVYQPRVGWVEPAGQIVLAPGEPYDRWSDVPSSWIGYVPFFRSW